MGWLRDRLGRLRGGRMDVAERLTGGLLDLQQEEAELSDRGTVVRWLREMDPLTVRKFWSTGRGARSPRSPGAGRGEAVAVFLSDGKRTWIAAAPGAPSRRCRSAARCRH